MHAVSPRSALAGLMLTSFALFVARTADAVKFSISDAVQFAEIINTNAVFTTNVTISSGIEGPVWIPNGAYLIFSNRDGNKLEKLVPPSTMTDFLLPPAQTKPNGNILDMQERQINCECGSNGLAVVMITNGVITPLCNRYNGLKFYSPNDVAVKSDSTIWFTDPGYDSGLPLPSGNSIPPGFAPGLWVYRFNETNGNATVVAVATNDTKPNGICFSPDETKLYIADNGVNANQGSIRLYNVTSSNTLTGGSVFCSVSSGIADGIRCDVNGRIWAAAGDGVEIFAPDGHLIGKILCGLISNLCFGGSQYKTIYTTGEPYVCSFPVLVAGAVSDKRLNSAFDGTNMNVTWPAPSTGFSLQSSPFLGASAAWSNVVITPSVTNGTNQVSLNATNSAQFLRLQLNYRPAAAGTPKRKEPAGPGGGGSRPDFDAVEAFHVARVGCHQRHRRGRRVGDGHHLPGRQIRRSQQRIIRPLRAIDGQVHLACGKID